MIDKDTLLKKLEALRGEPIQEFVRKDEEWNDYTEYVDAEKICKKPVVSCCVFTYNQEKYIRECLDSIVSQKADFDYEVLVCEDCSTDGTLAICREFQARYPEKVRIIHANRNYYRGALNFRRGYELARGEYIAICEGDDYWCNDAKIQLQADVMGANPSVGLCLTDARIRDGQNKLRPWHLSTVPTGIIRGHIFAFWHLFGQSLWRDQSRDSVCFIMTASTMVRRTIKDEMQCRYEIFKWRLWLGDTTKWLGCAALADVYYLPEETSVYRLNEGSTLSSNAWKVVRDAAIVRIWFAVVVFGLSYEQTLAALSSLVYIHLCSYSSSLTPQEQHKRAQELWRIHSLRVSLVSPRNFILFMLANLGLLRIRGVGRLIALIRKLNPDLIKFLALRRTVREFPR